MSKHCTLDIIRNSQVVALVTLCIWALAGCACPPEKPQPKRPDTVHGWKALDEDGYQVVGDLLLRIGESSDNGVLGVSVVDTSPPKPCSHEGPYAYPNATIRFFRPSDHTVLCEHTWIPGGISLGAFCAQDLGINGLGLEINSQEGWVHLQLEK